MPEEGKVRWEEKQPGVWKSNKGHTIEVTRDYEQYRLSLEGKSDHAWLTMPQPISHITLERVGGEYIQIDHRGIAHFKDIKRGATASIKTLIEENKNAKPALMEKSAAHNSVLKELGLAPADDWEVHSMGRNKEGIALTLRRTPTKEEVRKLLKEWKEALADYPDTFIRIEVRTMLSKRAKELGING
jgi:hypothetical protein